MTIEDKVKEALEILENPKLLRQTLSPDVVISFEDTIKIINLLGEIKASYEKV